MEKTNEKNFQEIYFLEQNYQNLLFQKQSFQSELSEVESALKELEKSDENPFKILGEVMIKADKGQLLEELKEKKKLLETRISSINKQEDLLAEKLESLKNNVNN